MMTDQEAPKPYDAATRHEFELKIRELYAKLFIEATKQSIEFAKLIVTNLIWVNAAGLGALPVISKLAGVDGAPWAQKTQLFLASATYFAAGMFLALMCSLTIYLNFYNIAMTADADGDAEINILRQSNEAFANYPPLREFAERNASNALALAQTHRKWVDVYFWAAFLTGFASLGFFFAACFELVNINPTEIR